jgi:ABC-2 type transport system permease protein
MATLTAPAPLAAATRRAGLGGALRSEWTKIRSVRSTIWTLLALAVLSIGISGLSAWGRATHDTVAELQHADLIKQALGGTMLGQLIILVLGAMVITSEYATGMIHTSLTVQPRRMNVFLAKMLVFTGVALVFGLVISFIEFFVAGSIFSSHGVSLTLSQPGALRAVVGAGLYIAACGLLSFGIGALLRHTAAAITTGFGLLFVITVLSNFLPQSWQNDINPYLPMNAGGSVWATHIESGYLSSWVGFGVFMIYVAVAVIGGAAVFVRKDA